MEELTADKLKEEFDEIKLGDIKVLFLDVSSNCVGYSICTLNFVNKSAKLIKTGALWLDPDWDHAKKYSYIFYALSNYFWIVEQMDYVVAEQYSINPKKMMGGLVVPEMFGAIKVALHENQVKMSTITPQQWRSILGIKAKTTVDSKGTKKRDYKEPTKECVLKSVSIPDKVVSNITGNERTTPSDLYDSVAISLAWLKKMEFKVNTSDVKINTHIGSDIGEL